jgi:uncharacterized protein (DUF1697 family)
MDLKNDKMFSIDPENMTSYAALLRGILPGNPNMRNEKLRGVFESLGFTNVHTVINSGNVLFEAKSKNERALEAAIEKAIAVKLGFTSTTIIRSKEELGELLKKNPFKKIPENKDSYLIVTFLKDRSLEPKISTVGKDTKIVDIHKGAISSVVDMSKSRTPEFMRLIEKELGKEITTRTWKTIGRIVAKFESIKK